MEVLDANPYRSCLPHSPCAGNDPLLTVSNLSVRFRLYRNSESEAVKQISFAIAPGQIVGLLGESGCGKTTTALSIMRLLPPACVVSGSIQFHGDDLLQLGVGQLRGIRGSELSIIYQNSDTLNPVMRVGDQVMEVLRAHKRAPASQMREEIFALFESIGLTECDRIHRSYPHQLSGGQRRRITIAQALICKPKLVIADEPTVWLDSDTADEILDLIIKLRGLYNTAFLLISHDPEILAAVADAVLVMYAGQIVERGPSRDIFGRPMHPYTQALLRCNARGTPSKRTDGRKMALPHIPGQAPDATDFLPGCSFADRCCDHMAECDQEQPELTEISMNRSVRCFKHRAGA